MHSLNIPNAVLLACLWPKHPDQLLWAGTMWEEWIGVIQKIIKVCLPPGNVGMVLAALLSVLYILQATCRLSCKQDLPVDSSQPHVTHAALCCKCLMDWSLPSRGAAFPSWSACCSFLQCMGYYFTLTRIAYRQTRSMRFFHAHPENIKKTPLNMGIEKNPTIATSTWSPSPTKFAQTLRIPETALQLWLPLLHAKYNYFCGNMPHQRVAFSAPNICPLKQRMPAAT